MRFKLMFHALSISTLIWLLASQQVAAEENGLVKQTHIHIEQGVVYCDVQTFSEESYILKVLGGGSPMTIYWQFELLKKSTYWLNSSMAVVRIGRQVIPDLVTKRWLMRDLSSGVVHYTSDVYAAMRFLTEMSHIAVVDLSVLNAEETYNLKTRLYIHEGEWKEAGWWSSMMDWGEDMGAVDFQIPQEHLNGQE